MSQEQAFLIGSGQTTTADAAPKCQHCGQPAHDGRCPTVKAIEYFESGQIKRVEYMTPADYVMQIAPSYPLTPSYTPPLTPTWGISAGQARSDG